MRKFYKNEKTITSIKEEELANIDDVLDFFCVGGAIEFGIVYEVVEGAVVFECDEDDGNIGCTVAKLDNNDKE